MKILSHLEGRGKDGELELPTRILVEGSAKSSSERAMSPISLGFYLLNINLFFVRKKASWSKSIPKYSHRMYAVVLEVDIDTDPSPGWAGAMPAISRNCRLLIKQFSSRCHCVPFFETFPEEYF